MYASGTRRSVGPWPLLAIALLALSCGRKKPHQPEQELESAKHALTASEWPAPAVTATNSVLLQTSARVVGDLAVTQASPGPVLSSNAELTLSTSARITGNAKADTLSLGTSSSITGEAAYNTRSGIGTVGSATTPLALPLPIAIPALPPISPGTTAVSVGTSQTKTLAAGAYGAVTAGTSAKLVLSGVYHMTALTVGTSGRVECTAACEIRVSGRISISTSGYLGPATGSGIGPGNVQVFVAGSNGSTGPNGTPPSLKADTSTLLNAYILAPNGTVKLSTSTALSGKIVALDVNLGTSTVFQGRDLPIITQQPQAVTVAPGASATFTVVASGQGLSYQWLRNGASITGATTDSYTLASPTSADNGAFFSVRISNAAGSVTSDTALLTVNACLTTDTTCDGVDDDCNGAIDDGYVVTPTTCGVGGCARAGVRTCVNGVVQDTCIAGTPAVSDETCDGIDDNCNGIVDEGFLAQPTSCGLGICQRAGTIECQAGQLVTQCTAGTPAPADDSCNGLDDNCDGNVDEGYVAQPTSCGTGACLRGGTVQCQSGALVTECTPGAPAASDDTCNGVDDNCDGQIDEGYVPQTISCGVNACMRFGILQCLDGVLVPSCAPGLPSPDSNCNGIDDDCDGQIDEEYVPEAISCGVGACQRAGTTNCAAGAVVNVCAPGAPAATDDTCNGVDDNCDGQIDEGYMNQPLSCGIGACARTGTINCRNGAPAPDCTPGTPAADDATCNGVDEDCDGQVDEDYQPQSVSCGVGACQASGTTVCTNGRVTDSCTPGIGTAKDEVCNGIDDDCDGQVDEDCMPQPTSCGVGACTRSGTIRCDGGRLVSDCVAGPPAGDDVTCDGIDDNCNGQNDEGYVSQITSCGVGACGATGNTSCVAGTLVDSCKPLAPAPTDTTCNGIDDDCDGQADEDYVPETTHCGVGACAANGETSCVAGQVLNSCSPGTPAPDDSLCNAADDDCDGQVDEDFLPVPTHCGVGACMAAGTLRCISGIVTDSCAPGVSAPDDATCDGTDDDCDGTADEHYLALKTSCGIGACSATGNSSCVAGVVQQNCTPGAPAPADVTCDGSDDNCNGTADEGYLPRSTSCGVGACASHGNTSCVAGAEKDSCAPGTPAPSDTNCNGIDDNCNGAIDEGYVPEQTSCGTGACLAQGSRTCANGQLSDDCKAGEPAVSTDTTCDSVDNDCDGQVDEDYVPRSLSCGVGACAATGATACEAGSVVEHCKPGSPAASDSDCNGIDDDCDGSIDEGFTPRCSGTAIERCNSGALTHQECQDTNPCNGSETCVAASCKAGTAPDLSDGNACTADGCDPVRGIQHTPVAAGTGCGSGQGCDGQGQCITKPLITGQPQDTTVAPGQTAVFTVVAVGDSLNYQWRRLGQDIPGATGASYTKANVEVADEGVEYVVVVSNAAGTATSNSAVLHISDTEGPKLVVAGEAARSATTDMITLTGTATDNGTGAASVVVQSDRFQGEVSGILSPSTGAFSIEVPLRAGVNQLKVIATDAKGNTTQQTIVVTLGLSIIPTITITSPTSGARILTDTVDVRGTVRSSLDPSQIRLLLGDVLRFPTGSNGDYTFVFTGVRLVAGSNVLTVRAETTAGVVTAQVVVTQGSTTADTGSGPSIRVAGAQSDMFVTSRTLQVNGTVDALRCVSSVTVNGAEATITGVGASISFAYTLTLSAGSTAQPIAVLATDCDGRTATVSYQVTYDEQAPQINVGLTPAPAVHTVTTTPFVLTGSIAEPNLAGFTIGQQSIGLLPTGSGTWDFTVSLPLTRAVDTPFELVAWDRAGNKTTYSILVRLDVPFDIEVIAPGPNASYSSADAQVSVSAVARVVGLAATSTVTARVDGNTPYLLKRSGDTFNGTVSVDTAGSGSHQMVFEVRDSTGRLLLSKSVAFTVKSTSNLALEASLQQPLNESQNVEPDQTISVVFNRPIDPTKFTMEVRQTVHGKQYKKASKGAELGHFNQIDLEDVVRDNELVPGSLSFLPGNQLAAFYPLRELSYGASVQLTGMYSGQEVIRGTFLVRPLPTLLVGFVSDQYANPLVGMPVTISGPATRTAVTNQFGAFSFGYGDYSEAIPAGHYLLTVNPGLEDRRYGVSLHYVDAYAERYTDLGLIPAPLLSSGEPFRVVSSGTGNIRLAEGALVLDLSQASVEFAGGLAKDVVHTQLLWRGAIGYAAPEFVGPAFAYSLQPMGIGVTGDVNVDFVMPSPWNTEKLLNGIGDRVVVLGLDPKSLQLVPAGVAKIDRTTGRARTERPLLLSRLDFVAVTLKPNAAAQSLLARFSAGELELDQLTTNLMALR